MNVLVSSPIGRYSPGLLDAAIYDSSTSMLSDSNNSHEQHRSKRIYWENLAFHAADFNRKTKKSKQIKALN